MLKIKDNVNLCLLAKYGFSYDYSNDSVYFANSSFDFGILRIFMTDRLIYIHPFDKGLNVLYRLIKDDLVELV